MGITVNYFLNKSARTKGADKIAIIGRVSYGFTDTTGKHRQTFKFGTGYSVPPKALKGGKVNGSIDRAAHINSKLAEYAKRAQSLYLQCEDLKQFPTANEFKNRLISATKHVIQERSFIEDFKSYIEIQKGRGKAISLSTIKNLNQALNRLQAMSDAKRYPLEYSTINLEFYAKFIGYCNTVEVNEGQTGLSKNTIGGTIKMLKSFLNFATANGWNSYQYYKLPAFKILSEKIAVVSLSETEIETLAALDLSKRPRLKLAADYFILGAETGLRFSDYSKVTKDKIKEVSGGYDLHVKTQKTKTNVVVPLSRLAMDVLARYNFHIPKPPANQTLNFNLKEVMKLAGIDKVVSSHDARRSYATNQYKAGTPIKFIQLITGHATEQQLRAYIGIDLIENSAQVRASNSKYQIDSKGLLNRNLKIA